MPALTALTDESFMATVMAQDRPVLAYFHDPALEVCEFMDLAVKEVARTRSDELRIVTLDTTKNTAITEAFSIPEPPVCMIFRDDVILGYRLGKANADNLAAWIDRTLEKPSEDGVRLDEFTSALKDRHERQSKNDAARLQAARNRSYTANAISMAGGIAIAALFPPLGFGAIGLAIAGYHAVKSLELYRDKAKRPQPATSILGQVFEAAGNLATIAGSFSLLAAALTFSAVPAIAGVAAGTLMILTSGIRFGNSIGRHLPLNAMLRGSLAQHAQERANRNPDKPLEEFSPPKPLIAPERAPSPAIRETFANAGEGTPKPPSPDATDRPAIPGPGGPKPF